MFMRSVITILRVKLNARPWKYILTSYALPNKSNNVYSTNSILTQTVKLGVHGPYHRQHMLKENRLHSSASELDPI